MSREIELRCWNEHGKCFHGMSELGDKLHLFNNKNPSYVIEQFTGMLDCKGAKIFEGDRVSIFDTDDDEFMMCGVIKFGVRGYPAFDIYDDKNAPYSDDYNTLTNDEDFRFLVIGNIHQNSEQLK